MHLIVLLKVRGRGAIVVTIRTWAVGSGYCVQRVGRMNNPFGQNSNSTPPVKIPYALFTSDPERTEKATRWTTYPLPTALGLEVDDDDPTNIRNS